MRLYVREQQNTRVTDARSRLDVRWLCYRIWYRARAILSENNPRTPSFCASLWDGHDTEETMTWKQWYALEILTGTGIWLATMPLSLERFAINGALVIAFSIFYHRRVQAQKSKS